LDTRLIAFLVALAVLGAAWWFVVVPWLERFNHWALARSRRPRVVVYDKADYHVESVQEAGLPEVRAAHFIAFFVSWLLRNELASRHFVTGSRAGLRQVRSGSQSMPLFLLQRWDGVLSSDLVSEEGNAFARAYYDPRAGAYYGDFTEVLQKGLPTPYHVEYTAENEAAMLARIDRRYREWKQDAGTPLPT
jgi:hypothetical protein